MAIDITKGSHKAVFLSKVNSAMGNGGHIYNVAITQNRDNGELVIRNTRWTDFDRYTESSTAIKAADFTGLIQGQSTSNPGYWYVEVTSVATNVVLLYNSPVSEYGERDLQDEKLFYNKSGATCQGLELSVGDVIELSANAFSGTIAAGSAVTYDAANKVYAI